MQLKLPEQLTLLTLSPMENNPDFLMDFLFISHVPALPSQAPSIMAVSASECHSAAPPRYLHVTLI